MPVQLNSPYSNALLPWLRGNLHTHTTKSDGPLSPQETLDIYAARGYDFVMLSDHDQVVDIAEYDSHGMTLIPGNEITADGCHILHVNAHSHVLPLPDRQAVIDAVRVDGGFAICCHPNWMFTHCPQENLEKWQGYTGIEIFNGVTRRVEGFPVATDRWDRLLTQDRRVWGFGNDDPHKPDDYAVAWNVVQSESRSTDAIVSALQNGRFYVSTGVVINRIQVHGTAIGLQTANAQRIVVSGNNYRRLATVDAPEILFTLPDLPWLKYVRIECWGPGEQMAWTQPFFIERS